MIHEELNKALAKWIEIVGPSETKIGNWDYTVSVEELNEAQQLDDTGVTTAMVLQSMWDFFSLRLKVSLRDIIEEKPEALRSIELYKDLQKLLHTPLIDEEVAIFQTQVVENLRFYGATNAIEMAMDRGSLGLLRRDALRSMKIFNVFQFVHGKATTTKMKYAQMVYRFDNMQSLVSAMINHGEPGVALCHLLDPDGLEFSYFAFSIWNGGTLTVVTDKRDYSHPLQKQMERCPGRSLRERWGKHHFPYELLNAEFHDNGKQVTFEQKPGLVRYNMSATRIAEVWSLEPDVVIWLIMVFEQLQQKYFVENHLLPDLSYTGDVVQKQVPVHNNLMKLNGWVPPTVKIFSTTDLTLEKTADNWEYQPTGFNTWFENRYRDQVPDTLLNLVSDGKRLLPAPIADNDERILQLYETIKSDLIAPSPYDFGTSKQLIADNEYVARYNQAKIIQYLAVEEFKRRKGEILSWYTEKVQANRNFLINATCNMELILPFIYENGVFSDELLTKNRNRLNIEYDKNGHCHNPNWFSQYGVLIGNFSRVKGKWYCALLPDVAANLSAFIEIDNPSAISIVTGVPIDELPDVLQHYQHCEPYTGNHILNRIDPMEWVVDNPWKKLCLNIKVVLSRKGFKERRRLLHLPEFADWSSIERSES